MAGHEAKLLDLSFYDEMPDISGELEGVGMVGISSATALFGRAVEVLRAVKKRDAGLPVVIGGPHATALPEETLRAGFDIVVIGEGEVSAPLLADSIEEGKSLDSVPGIVFRRGEEVISVSRESFIEDLDSLPFPDRSMLDYERYFGAGLKQAGMVAMRGCPYHCSYCKPMQERLFGARIRRRSAENVALEVDTVARSVVDRVLFRDDAFTTNRPGWFRDLKKQLDNLRTPLWGWVCQGRVDQVNPKLLDAMQEAGLRMIAFGVESGSQRVLDYYRKGITVAQTERAFDLCRERGIATHAFIMIGAPIETADDIEATLRLLERIRPNSISPSITTPAPGTALYEQAIKEGLYNIKDWAESDYMCNQRPMKLPHLTLEQILEAKELMSVMGLGYGEPSPTCPKE